MPVKIFICYAHEDEALLKKLKAQLAPLQRQGLIDVWHDQDINAGTEWEQEIIEQLNAANIILLLISPDFMVSDYCYGIEMKRAIARHNSGEVQVIPIILRPISWHGAPFGKLQALPKRAKPITSWRNKDEAFFNVVEGIRREVDKLIIKTTFNPLAAATPLLASKVMETKYRGYRFRSRLEAKWAVFFDKLGIKYIYEPEGYDLEGTTYWPDFYLPSYDYFIMIKGNEPTEEEQEKAELLSLYTNKRTFIFAGDVWMPSQQGSYTVFPYAPPCIDTYDTSLNPSPILEVESSLEVRVILQKVSNCGIAVDVKDGKLIFRPTTDAEDEWPFSEKYISEIQNFLDHIPYSRTVSQILPLFVKHQEEIVQALTPIKGWERFFTPQCEAQETVFIMGWCQCSWCGAIRLVGNYAEDFGDGPFSLCHEPCVKNMGIFKEDSPDLVAAYVAARQARFEAKR